jgi:hypothetical protein
MANNCFQLNLCSIELKHSLDRKAEKAQTVSFTRHNTILYIVTQLMRTSWKLAENSKPLSGCWLVLPDTELEYLFKDVSTTKK